jgi:SAM-dependent methyltransferase
MPDPASSRYEFYSAQYARFGSKLAAEIACGSGGPSLALAADTQSLVTGIDIEADGIAHAKSLAQALGIGDRASFIVADCSKRLPFADQSFDVVVCVDAILHLNDRFQSLKDWCRIVRPAGKVFFSDAAVLTGAVSKPELDIRAAQGEFVLVPPGVNEAAIAAAGLHLRSTRDTTKDMAIIAKRLHAARAARSDGLRKEEGDNWFEKRQRFLAVVTTLADDMRMSRFVYVAEKVT